MRETSGFNRSFGGDGKFFYNPNLNQGNAFNKTIYKRYSVDDKYKQKKLQDQNNPILLPTISPVSQY
jgi:hypothetical protein